MATFFGFANWSLRAKMIALFAAVSLLPLGIATYADLVQTRAQLLEGMKNLLAARGDQIVHELDGFHAGYQRAVDRIARFPGSAAYCSASPRERQALHEATLGLLATYPVSDSAIRDAALVDGAGRIVIATEPRLIGLNLSTRPAMQVALQGRAVISDPYVSPGQSGAVPTIAYLTPMRGSDGQVFCVAALWVRATAIWDKVTSSDALAGPGSFAVLFDAEGIRIAHSANDDLVFHPGGKLDPATLERMIAERRFGDRTRALLEDVRETPELFRRARAPSPDPAVFRGFAQVNQTWNYAVARRFQTVPWTVFYMVPEAMFTEQVAQATRDKLLLATGIIVAAALAGLAFAASILRPVQALGHAAAAIARGDLATRIKESRGDELGQLGASFNAMAEGLQRSRDELEQRVRERTAALEVEIAERRRSEEALRAGEERTRLIVDTALDAVVTMDGAGMITGWSPQAERTFGWNKAEAIGRSLAETIIPPRYRDAHRRGLARYLATGEARVLNKRIELFALHRHGHEFPVELSITPIRTGVAVSFSAFVRDITERKRAEQSLRESQQMLQGIIDNSPAVIYVKDLEGRYLLVNRRFTELFHLSNEATVGRTDHDIFPQQVADAFRDMDRRVATAQHALAEEEVAPHDDGPHTYISVKCPLWDERGKPYAVFGISTDITERKRAETKQQSQLARLELLNRITRAIGERQDLPSIFQAVVRRLEDDMPLDFGCVCLHDPVAESLIVTSVGVRSQPLALELALPAQAPIPIDQNGLSRCVRGQLVYEPDVSQVPHPFPQRLARGGLRALVVAPLIVESEVFGVLVAARREAGAFSSDDCEFLRQLSEHVGLAAHQAQLHSALQRSYADLRQTQQAVMQQERLRALGQMAGGIAHDINNAISPVALYTESLLERENLSPRARASLETIQRAIDDVAQTVARMREFYRPREPQLALAAVELNRLVDQVIDLTRARWSDMPQQRGIVVHLVTDPASDLPVVMGVESEIREALINLVFNATDAMPEGGTLTLRTGRAASAEGSGAAPRAFVEVADTGIGMDEDTRRRCLEPFFTTKGERGTGLGLAMVYGVAQRHGAEIGIESQVGSGTTVRLTFPVPVAPATEGAKRAAADAPRTRLRVLIVDDDPILLSSLRDTLEGDGHVIEAANGGQQGIDAFHAANGRGQPFAAVITDLGMPHIDGRRVAQAVKEASPHTPVILLTGWGMRLINEGERPLHVDRVLSKPPKLQELREALASFS